MSLTKLTVKQAADHLGISKDTILRAISKGELPAELDLGSTGSQYWLDPNDVGEWRKSRKRRMRRGSDSAIFTPAAFESTLPTNEPQASQVSGVLNESHSFLEAPLSSAPESHASLQEPHASVQESHTSVQESHTSVQESHASVQESHTSVQESHASVPVAAHLAALDLVKTLHEQLTETQHQVAEERRQREQAERTRMALEWQMHQYRTALAEQAESLAESQAMRRVAEARLEVVAEIAPGPTHAEGTHLDRLKLGKPEKKTWKQRIKGWLGMRQAKG